MDGKSAMLKDLYAKHVLFTVNVPMWEVSILKKLQSQVYSGFYRGNGEPDRKLNDIIRL